MASVSNAIKPYADFFFSVSHQLIGCTDMLAPLSEEGNCGTLSISHTSVTVKDVASNMRKPQNKSTVPLKKRSVKKNSTSDKIASKP